MLAKNWCFTLNNPTESPEDFLERVSANELVTFMVFQLEVGEQGTEHYQGYIQLEQKKRLAGVKEITGVRSHCRVASGTPAENLKYCSKEETRVAGPWLCGTMRGGKGRRSDLQDVRNEIKDNPSISTLELLEKFPDVMAKYPRFVQLCRAEYLKPEIIPFFPRDGWQTELRRKLSEEASPRNIMWYWEAIGNTGKSYFALNYADERGGRGYVITGGRHADIYYAYQQEKVVFFDWPRTSEETFPYGVLEAFKNGYFLSTKYESRGVRFKIPHVVVFANFAPDTSKLSLDRWEINIIQ